MLIHEATSSSKEDVRVRARALRDQYASEAAAYAYRIERASATAPAGVLAQWAAGYRRSTARCRVLGELIRGEREAT